MEEIPKIKVKGPRSLNIKSDLVRNQNSTYNNDSVSIICKIDALVKMTGTVTGKLYIWSGAGSVQSVDLKDKDEILNKKKGRACCGGESNTSIFELVE